MANDLHALANRLEKRAEQIKVEASNAAVSAAMTIVGDLAFTTPVDTSEAVSNWQVTLGSPTSSNIAPHFPGELGSTRNASAAETIAQAKATLSGKKPGQPIYITNNTPYISDLNNGTSRQQPAGFVERAVLLGRLQLAKFRKRIIRGR